MTESPSKSCKNSGEGEGVDEDDENSNSGVSGAAARTTTRALALARGGRVGLKASAKASAKAASKVSVGRIPVKHVAKIADRGATGLDMVEHAELEKLQKRMKKGGGFEVAKKLLAGLGGFVKSGLLGVVAWEGFDILLAKGTEIEGIQGEAAAEQRKVAVEVEPSRRISSLRIAFGAGAAAGVAHGLVSSFLDSVSESYSAKKFSMRPKFPHLRLLHHGISHAALFGLYETGIGFYDGSGGRAAVVRGDASDDDTINIEHAFVVATVGGTSGVASQLLSTAIENIDKAGLRKGVVLSAPKSLLSSAFLPSALGFLAFEYSKDLYSGAG